MYSNISRVEYQTTIRRSIRPQIMAEYQVFLEYQDQVELLAEV